MDSPSHSRTAIGTIAEYYPELEMGYLFTKGVRVGFRTAALMGFDRAPREGDRVEADINDDDGIAVRVRLLSQGDRELA
ncbi:MAG TPA: hypothetical protein VNK91_06275 [Burkholderiaceae bacterium]|jgi:hypothetical protein|nr:hypothetical protein [Burkholderiaceae bacterium]